MTYELACLATGCWQVDGRPEDLQARAYIGTQLLGNGLRAPPQPLRQPGRLLLCLAQFPVQRPACIISGMKKACTRHKRDKASAHPLEVTCRIHSVHAPFSQAVHFVHVKQLLKTHSAQQGLLAGAQQHAEHVTQEISTRPAALSASEA